MRSRIAALVALLMLAAVATPAAAITKGGTDDAGDHPMVGQLLFYLPDAENGIYPDTGAWGSCTGTLVSPTVIVTAGHCTFGTGRNGESTTTEENRFTAEDGNGSGGNDVWITFNEDDAQWAGWPASLDANGDPVYPTEAARYEARSSFLNSNPLWIRATAYPHPGYDDEAFVLHDMGVVVLSPEDAQPGPYATVAPEGWLDRYAGRRNDHRFEVVGYGLNEVRGAGKVEIGGDTRMQAQPKLVNLNSRPARTWIVISNNAATGGTCFGDSGGPTFDNPDSLLLVAVTSWGLSPNCRGIGGAYRIDQADDLAFLAEFGIAPAG